MANDNNLIGCIVETKNPAIVRMMKSRGCAYSENNGSIQFSKEPKILPFKKTYRDDIKFKILGTCNLEVAKGIFVPIDGSKVWKTSTGWENYFIAEATIHDKKTNKKINKMKAQGIGVYSERQNHYYGMLQIENVQQLFYFEKWFDDDGKVVSAKPNSDIQSNRVYEI